MPFGDVIDFANEGGILRARERLDAINDAALVAGTMKKSDRRAHIRDLNRAASGSASKPEKATEEVTPQATAQVTAQLASIGIPVERV